VQRRHQEFGEQAATCSASDYAAHRSLLEAFSGECKRKAFIPQQGLPKGPARAAALARSREIVAMREDAQMMCTELQVMRDMWKTSNKTKTHKRTRPPRRAAVAHEGAPAVPVPAS